MVTVSLIWLVPAKSIDAMAMAKPIIGTNVSDISEILDGCGWIIEPENPKQLAKTIKYVFDHPIEAKEKGKNARDKCKNEYSYDAVGECLESVFDVFSIH